MSDDNIRDETAIKRDDLFITIEHEVRATFAQPGDISERTCVFQNVQALPEPFHVVGGLNSSECVDDIRRWREQLTRIQIEE